MTEPRDLGALVQALRILNWNASFVLPSTVKTSDLWASYDDPDSLQRSADLCRQEGTPEAVGFGREYEQIARELASGPRVPTERELVERFHAGELGDRTVRILLDLDPWEFFDLCARHGRLPLQEDDES